MGRADDWSSTFIYGFAHFGKSLFWYTSEILFAYFLTEIAGLSGRQMGVAIAAALAFSALLDPIVGLLMRRTLADARRAIRLQFFGSIASAMALAVLLLGAWAPAGDRLDFAIASGMAFRLAYALYDLPQNALVSLATKDPVARTRVAAMRLVCSGLAAIVIFAATYPLALLHATPRSAGPSLFRLGLMLSIVAVATAALMVATLGRSISVSCAEKSTSRSYALPKNCFMPLALAFLMSATIPLFSKLQPYLTTYGTLSAGWGVVIGCAVPIGSMVSQRGWSFLLIGQPRSQILRSACVVVALAAFAFWLAVPASLAAASVAAAAFGAGSGGLALCLWAAMADAVAGAPGREGWCYGLFTASFKLGLAAGGLELGLFLGGVDFRGSGSATIAGAMALAASSGGVACFVVSGLLGGRLISRRISAA